MKQKIQSPFGAKIRKEEKRERINTTLSITAIIVGVIIILILIRQLALSQC